MPFRKQDQILINLNNDVKSGITTGFEKYRFNHQALPEIDLDDIDQSQLLFKKVLKSPLFISSMTGGSPESAKLNQFLAEASQQMGLAMGIGSQRTGIEHPETAYSFKVRKYAPDILLFANLGAIQLNYTYTIEHCKRAVEMIEADALILHLNALQEAIQENGDTKFSGLINKIEHVCKNINIPVIIKEVGWGISESTAKLLMNAGVSAIDVAGAGGTSWSQVEKFRLQDEYEIRTAEAFRDWGIPTAESIVQVKIAAPEMIIFASGGLNSGVEIAKAIALGATLGGMAGKLLRAADLSLQELHNTIEAVIREIQLTMFALGASNLDQLKKVQLRKD